MKDRKGHTGMAEEDIRTLLGIPDYYGILNVVSLGVKAEASKKESVQAKVHQERY